MLTKQLIPFIIFASLAFADSSQAQWVQTKGPYGGDVSSIAVIGTNIFAGTGDGLGGYLFLSTNNGGSWTRLNTPWGQSGVGALMASGPNLFALAGSGIYLSTDNGANWKMTTDSGLTAGGLPVPPSSFVVSGTTLFAAVGGYFFVDNAGVYRSTNNGATWTASGTGITNNHVHALITNGSNLFAGTSKGIFLSTDNGAGWKLIDTGLSNTGIYALAVIGTSLFCWNEGSWHPSLNRHWCKLDSDQSQRER